MDLFLIVSVALASFLIVSVYRKPKTWPEYIRFVPLAAFMIYARVYGMTNDAWYGAFILAGLCSLATIAILINQRIMLDRIMLGVNCFFLLGAIGFLFNIEDILEWYSSSQGGPFFACIVVIGLITRCLLKVVSLG